MEKDRLFKIITIVALVISIIGVSIGFASLNASLNINSVSGTVTPETASAFNVQFSKVNNAITLGELPGVGTPALGSALTPTGSINITSGTTVTVTATFATPGDSITYSFYVVNPSTVDAFLKSINYSATEASCDTTGLENPATQNVDGACNGMDISIQVGTAAAATHWTDGVDIATNNTLAKIFGSTLGYVPVVLTLTYGNTAPALDGEINVDFGSITLGYSSVN